MSLGPLEYVVIGVQDDHGMAEILPALSTIEESGALHVLDLLIVSTDATGAVTMQEVSAVSERAAVDGSRETSPTSPGPGLLTAEDVHTLTTALPADATAVIVLLEHLWAQALTAAVQRAGGVLYTGGLIAPEAVTQLQLEADGATAEVAAVP